MAGQRNEKCPVPDHYAVLGVEPWASEEQVTAAFRGLLRALHPDLSSGGPVAEARLAEVVAAYRTLHDRGRRADYDAEHNRGRRVLPGRPVRVHVTPIPATSGEAEEWSRGGHRPRRHSVYVAPVDTVADLTAEEGSFRCPPPGMGRLLRAGPVRVDVPEVPDLTSGPADRVPRWPWGGGRWW